MKKLLLIILASVNMQAMEKSLPVSAKLPSANDLDDRFKLMNLAFFTEKTNVVQSLAGKELLPMIVVDQIYKAIWAYDDIMGDPNELEMLNRKVPVMLLNILKDCPGALDNLEAYGVLK